MTEWNAQDYTTQASLQETMAEEQLASLEWKGVESVLDIGCGDGKITARIAARLPGASVVGIDASHQMIAHASEKHRAPNLRFEVGDARALGFTATFDRIVSFNALHWVIDLEQALRSIRDALVPGGLASLRFVGKGERVSVEEVLEVVRRSPRWSASFEGYTPPFFHPTTAEFRAFAEAAGLQVHRCEMKEYSWDFQSPDRFAAWCRATFAAWTDRLAERDRPEFLADVVAQYSGSRVDLTSLFRYYQLQALLSNPGK